MRTILAVTLALGLSHGTALAAGGYDGLPDSAILPDNVIQVSPVVPAMGEHWADPSTLPLGPIYCVHPGKDSLPQFMMSQQDFADGNRGRTFPAWKAFRR